MEETRFTGRAAACAALAAFVLGAAAAGCQKGSKTGQAGGNTVQIAVTEKGFEPAMATVQKGQPVTLVVTRKTDQTCATEIVFPSEKKRYPLPLNRPVRIELASFPGDTLHYVCGMDMYAGVIVAQ